MASRWIGRGILIVVVSAGVAALLPAVRQALKADGGDLRWLQAPDRGSTLVALAVAIALTRVFVTLDHRKRN